MSARFVNRNWSLYCVAKSNRVSSDVDRDWLSRVASDPGLAIALQGSGLGVITFHKPIGIQIPDITRLLASSSAHATAKANASWCYPIVASAGARARRD